MDNRRNNSPASAARGKRRRPISGLRRHRHLAGALIALGSVIVTILAIELFLFFVLDIKCPGYRPDRFLQFSLLTGGIHKPKAEGHWYRYNDGSKYYVSINSYGFSDSERDLEKKRPRIALIGNSTIEFWEADPEDRGQYVIEDMLDGRFEVLNFGVRGYATDQVYLLFEHVGVHFSPDIVIYLLCVNDISTNARTNGKPYFIIDPDRPDSLILQGFPVKMERAPKTDRASLRAIDEFFRSKSFLFRKSRGLLMGIVGYQYPNETHFELRPYKKIYNEEDHRRMDLTLRIISMLDDFVRSNGMRFILVEGIYRPVLDRGMRDRLIAEYGDIFDFDRVTRALEDHSRAHGIEFLSLPRTARDQGIEASDLMHNEDNMHLDRRGIRFFAGSVVDRLHELGWVGEPNEELTLSLIDE
jgi:hypothetical protein